MHLLDPIQPIPLNVIVTGAAGFIGSHLCQALLERGDHVVAIDNFSNSHKSKLDSLQSQYKNNFFLHDLDLLDFNAILKIFPGNDLVFHLAAVGSVPRSFKKPSNTFNNNIITTHNVIRAMMIAKVPYLIFSSSSSVYGDHHSPLKQEPILGKSLSPYALSKRICELYIESMATFFKFEYIILRYFNVFGLGQIANNPYTSVIPKWALLKDQKQPVEVFGHAIRDFTYIKNVIHANLCAMRCSDNARNQIYNIATGIGTSLIELLDFMQIKDYQSKPKRQGDIDVSIADISKARDKLGYNPTYSLETGLKDMGII